MVNLRAILLSSAGLVSCVTWSVVAQAQVAEVVQAPQTEETQQSASSIEDIVVTARRREESGQRTPISVAAISSLALERANITRPTALSRVVAGLMTTPTVSFGGGSTAFIRGIGAQETALFSDPPVGQYRDGIYLGHSTTSGDVELLTLSRVEVLRGPQGTLFGRNTTGGAINLVTRDAYEGFGLTQLFRYGRFNEFVSATTVDTGQIGETGVAATISYSHRQRDGYVNDPSTSGSRDPGGQNSETVFAKVQAKWGDFRADYAFDFYDARTVPPYFQLTDASDMVRAYFANSPGGPLVIGNRRIGTIDLVDEPSFQIRNYGHALTLVYAAASQLNLKSITAHRHFRGDVPYSFSMQGLRGVTTTSGGAAVPVNIYEAKPKGQTLKQFTQELQAFGDIGRLSYTLGAFYFDEKGEEVNQTNSTLVQSPTLARTTSTQTRFKIDNSSKAIYAQLSYKPAILDDRLELTGGLRYNSDKRYLRQIASIAREGRKTFNNVSFAASAKMQWTPDLMTFARVSSAIRSGGFNTRTALNSPTFLFKPEKALSYEVGLKSQFLDNRVRFNAGLFYTEYRDLQVTQVLGVSSSGALTGEILNAKANFRGGEIELAVVPAKGLTLSANAGYVDPKYDAIFFVDPATGLPRNYADRAHFPYLPKLNANLSVLYEAPETDFGRPTFSVDYSYVSKRFFTPIEMAGNNPLGRSIASPAYGTLNSKITLSELPIEGADAEISLWAENITNKFYRVAGVDYGSLGFAGDIFSPPRTFGIDLKFTF